MQIIQPYTSAPAPVKIETKEELLWAIENEIVLLESDGKFGSLAGDDNQRIYILGLIHSSKEAMIKEFLTHAYRMAKPILTPETNVQA